MASDTHKLLSSVSAVEDNAHAKAALMVGQALVELGCSQANMLWFSHVTQAC